MNNIFCRKEAFWLLSLSALAVLGSGNSAVAQTKETSIQLNQSSTTEASPVSVNSTRVETSASTTQTSAQSNDTVNSALGHNPDQPLVQQSVTSPQQQTGSITPVPGTTATSSAAIAPAEFIQPEATTENSQQPSPVKSKRSHSKIAQSDINPGRATRGGSSYVGVGGNIGLAGGGSALGSGNFTVLSKIGLSRSLSVRPTAMIGDNTTILIPVTYDFSFNQLGGDPFSQSIPIAPYVGAGAAINTGNGGDFGFLVTGGVDVPVSTRFTATAAVNAAFFGDPSVGVLVGVGYNFRGL